YRVAPFPGAGQWSSRPERAGKAPPPVARGGCPEGCIRQGLITLGKQNMNKAQQKKFKALLEAKRDEIIKKAQETLKEDMMLDASDLPDEMDLASSEYLQSFTFRLRGREKVFLDKIHKALLKIEDGTF